MVTKLATAKVRVLAPETWLRGVYAEDDDWYAGGERGELFRSRDRGKTWTASRLPTDEPICSIVRYAGALWAAGVAGFVGRRTTDGWERVRLDGVPAGTKVIARLYADADQLYVVGRGVWRITGRGAACELVTDDLLTGFVRTESTTRIAVGENGLVARSTNRTWKIDRFGDQDFVGVVGASGSVVAARRAAFDNHDLVVVSDDDGKTFVPLDLGTREGERWVGGRLGCTCVASDGASGALVAGYEGLLIHISRVERASRVAPRDVRTTTHVSASAPVMARKIFSDGKTLYLLGERKVGWMLDGSSMAWSDLGDRDVDAIGTSDGYLWVCGREIWRAGRVSGSSSFTRFVAPTPPGARFRGIAADPGGTLWAAGQVVVRKPPGASSWEAFEGIEKQISSVWATSRGVVLLSAGRTMWIANADELAETAVAGAGALAGACTTPTGTLIVVGIRTGNGFAARELANGSFAAASLPQRTPPLHAVTALPDGRVIAGGEQGTLLVSYDGGATFTRLQSPIVSDETYTTLATHRGAVFAAGPSCSLVRIE